MAEITVQRRPGGALLVAGLFAHPEMVDAIAELLVDEVALKLATRVAELKADREDAPRFGVVGGMYEDACGALARHLASMRVGFRPRDLAPLASAVEAEHARHLAGVA